MTKALRVTIAFCIGLCIAACTSVPFDYPKTASEAIPPLQTTVLGQKLSEWTQEHDEKSGFVLPKNESWVLRPKCRIRPRIGPL